MIFQEENQLLQHIKLGHLYRVYLLYGEEKYLKELYLKRLVRLASPEQFEEFNFHRFDGGELEVDRLIEACESLPFLAGQRCVVVEKFDFEGMPAADREKLTRLLEDPPETTVLILVVDKEDFSAKKSAGAKKLIALCVLKTATLDAAGMGVEMEGGKPGWYDDVRPGALYPLPAGAAGLHHRPRGVRDAGRTLRAQHAHPLGGAGKARGLHAGQTRRGQRPPGQGDRPNH